MANRVNVVIIILFAGLYNLRINVLLPLHKLLQIITFHLFVVSFCNIIIKENTKCAIMKMSYEIRVNYLHVKKLYDISY